MKKNIKNIAVLLKPSLITYKYKLVFVFLLGALNSLLQGIGVVLIIPLLEMYSSQQKGGGYLLSLFELFGWENNLLGILFLYLGVLISITLVRTTYNYFSQYVIAKFVNIYYIDAFRHVVQSKWSFFTKYSASQLNNLFITESKSVRMIATTSFKGLQSLLVIVGQLIFALLISWKLTLLSTFVIVGLFLFQRKILHKGINIGERRVKLNEGMQLLLKESFNSMKLLISHGLTGLRQKEYEQKVYDSLDNELNKAKIDAISEIIFVSLGSLMVVSIVYVGITLQLVTIPELIGLMVLLSRTINQSQGVMKVLNQLSNRVPSFKRFSEVLRVSAQMKRNVGNLESLDDEINRLELRDVSFSYHENALLEGLNLTFERGKTYLLFGPSGSGKTTTLDIIAELLEPKEGEVYVNDLPTKEGLKNNISYVLQETILFKGTIRENILLGREEKDADLKGIIVKSGLQDLINRLPEGIHTNLQENGGGLSGGEKQRLSLARSLVRDSQILLLDEFTSALDVASENKVLQTLNDLKSDKIIIVVAHRESLKDWADIVYDF